MKLKDSENPILVKSKSFAIEIIKMVQYLRNEKKEYTLSDQILRSGTSIGANCREGIHAASKADFYNKLNVACKEAAETQYWLELLVETGYISKNSFTALYEKCSELVAILVSITKTQKES